MPLRALFKYLANNEQLVQKLADSYPVRRAAQLCISLYYRVHSKAGDKIPSMDSLDKEKITSFLNKFKQNVSQEWTNAKKQIKDNEHRFKK